MAKEDRTHVGEPEEVLAETFSSSLGLTVPVNVESIIEDFADIEFDDIPNSIEAVLVRKKDARPLVVLSRSLQSPMKFTRYRFTIAHELGHIIIPWQIATMLCHAQFSYHASDFAYKRIEAEANRFASELLVPSAWATDWLQRKGSTLAHRVLTLASTAKVSPDVALIAAARVCHADCMLLLLDKEDKVLRAAQSAGSFFKSLPAIHTTAPFAELERLGVVTRAAVSGDRTILAVDGSATVVGEALLLPVERSTDILRSILVDVEPDEAKRKLLSSRTNGVIGYTNTKTSESADTGTMLTRLRMRFLGREELAVVLEHSKFNEFLCAKAHELTGVVLPPRPRGKRRLKPK